MRLVSLLLILLLGFQCLPHSVRVKVVAVCMDRSDVNPDDVPVLNPATMLEDEIPHFILSPKHARAHTVAVSDYGTAASHWGDPGCRMPGNRAHDIETPPPNRAA